MAVVVVVATTYRHIATAGGGLADVGGDVAVVVRDGWRSDVVAFSGGQRDFVGGSTKAVCWCCWCCVRFRWWFQLFLLLMVGGRVQLVVMLLLVVVMMLLLLVVGMLHVGFWQLLVVVGGRLLPH
jgi:hypothetical protein